MNMKLRTVVVAVALIGASAALSAAPAAAGAPALCAGTGVMQTDPYYYPLPGYAPTSGAFSGMFGTCVGAHVGPAYVAGSMTGFCGRASGTITFNGHHTSPFQVAGTVMVISSGEVVGTLTITPAVGHSCLTGAPVFQVSGTVVLR